MSIPEGALRDIMRNVYYGIKRRAGHWKNRLANRNPKVLILTYHSIREQMTFDPLRVAVGVDTFRRQTETLARRYPIISLSDAMTICEGKEARQKINLVLTFDDGYSGSYEFGFPILKRMGLPAAFFIPTDYVGKDAPLWDWELVALLGRRSRRSHMLKQFDGMKGLARQAIEDALKTLRRDSGVNAADASDRCLAWNEVREIASAGMEIGSHGMSHRSLARIPLSEAHEEIFMSKRIIEENTGKRCEHFAFPFGSSRDYNEELIELVRQAGYKSCLLNLHGYNDVTKWAFRFKRIIMEESTDMRYLLG